MDDFSPSLEIFKERPGIPTPIEVYTNSKFLAPNRYLDKLTSLSPNSMIPYFVTITHLNTKKKRIAFFFNSFNNRQTRIGYLGKHDSEVVFRSFFYVMSSLTLKPFPANRKGKENISLLMYLTV